MVWKRNSSICYWVKCAILVVCFFVLFMLVFFLFVFSTLLFFYSFLLSFGAVLFSGGKIGFFFFLIKRICERDVCAPLFVVVIVVVILTAILTCCVDVFVFVWFDRYQSIRWNVLNFMFGRGFIFNSNLHQSIECQCKNGTNETTR